MYTAAEMIDLVFVADRIVIQFRSPYYDGYVTREVDLTSGEEIMVIVRQIESNGCDRFEVWDDGKKTIYIG